LKNGCRNFPSADFARYSISANIIGYPYARWIAQGGRARGIIKVGVSGERISGNGGLSSPCRLLAEFVAKVGCC
jgi:hypothetical protein